MPPMEEDKWDTVCLEEVLGELFEGADPWNELSRVLGLPVFPADSTDDIEDTLSSLGALGRRGVGYSTSEGINSPKSLPTSLSSPETYQSAHCQAKIVCATAESSISDPMYTAHDVLQEAEELLPRSYPSVDPLAEKTTTAAGSTVEERPSSSPAQQSSPALPGDSARQSSVPSLAVRHERSVDEGQVCDTRANLFITLAHLLAPSTST